MTYSDDLLIRATGVLRDGTVLLADVAALIDVAEPIRRRLDGQLRTLDGVLDELDRILDDARDELL